MAETRFQELCDLIPPLMQRVPIPGVAFGILDGADEHIAGFGVTSVDHPLTVTPETLYQVGSITKTFTMLAIMRMVEMGKLDLDVPVRSYLPDLKLKDPVATQQVTIRHLLTHTGGWEGDYFNDFGSGEDALAKMVAKVADLPQLTPLGEVYSYNNAGFYIAGRIIEVITGQPYETALKELVLAPLEMRSAFFFAQDVITYRFVVGHEVNQKQAVVARPWAIGRAAHSIGGLVTNVGDLFKYARFLMGNGVAPNSAPLLKPESLAQMFTPQRSATGLNSVGLSWFIQDLDGIRLFRHGGGTKGQVTEFLFAPSRRFALAILTNCEEGDSLIHEIEKQALKTYLGVTISEPVAMEISAELLAEYTGQYEAAAQIRTLKIVGDGLVMEVQYKGGFPTPEDPPSESPPPLKVALYERDKLFVLEDPMKGDRGEFLRDENGKVVWMRLGGRIHRKT